MRTRPRSERGARMALTLTFLLSTTAAAQRAEDPPAERRWSAVVGGFILPPSLLQLGKGSYSIGHFAAVVELTRDSVSLERSEGSRDDYVLWAGSAGARAYTGRGGSGGFVEVSGGFAALSLASTDPSWAEPRTRWSGLPIASGAVGGRLVLPMGLVGELGLRTILPLATRRVFTSTEEPAWTAENLPPHGWSFTAWTPTNQLYLALGAAF